MSIDSISELPVTPYTEKIQPGDITAIADANGMIEVKTGANLYSMVITAAGYQLLKKIGLGLCSC